MHATVQYMHIHILLRNFIHSTWKIKIFMQIAAHTYFWGYNSTRSWNFYFFNYFIAVLMFHIVQIMKSNASSLMPFDMNKYLLNENFHLCCRLTLPSQWMCCVIDILNTRLWKMKIILCKWFKHFRDSTKFMIYNFIKFMSDIMVCGGKWSSRLIKFLTLLRAKYQIKISKNCNKV